MINDSIDNRIIRNKGYDSYHPPLFPAYPFLHLSSLPLLFLA